MHIKTGGNTYPCRDYWPGTDTISFPLDGAAPEELGDTIELCTEDGFVMLTSEVADWLRWEVRGGALILTNLPLPEPGPVDLDSFRTAKLAELSAAGNAAIVVGVDVVLPSTGETEHFALEETDQINLSTALSAVGQGAAGYPYHADGQLCRMYPAADILAISHTAIQHKLCETTYCNHMLVWVRRAETVEELAGITYGIELPPDLESNLVAVLAAAGGSANA
ncbi:MAG TPA: hypothetical protein VN421_05950 [Pseudoflavonifractor sp.]|nr:hypothetical protein [Pseudoflavonifractor sp.]